MLRKTFLILALTSSILAASAQTTAPSPETAPAAPAATTSSTKPALTPSDKIATRDHTLTIDDKTLNYTSHTGYLPLKDEKGNTRANLFFMAYTAKPKDPNRPVTFVFNGGPGAASAWLHIGTAGPMRIAFTDEGNVPPPPYKLVENPYTWLTHTDLVFIDPVGTGYSRAANPEQAKEFYGVQEDVAAVAEFIRLYTTRYERWDSPKFLAGESYGTTRAAVLAEYLHERQGMAINGVILISTVLNFATLSPTEANDLPYALFLPTYAATAWYHNKLPAKERPKLTDFLKEVEQFALTDYNVALAKGAWLSEAERAKIAARLAAYTGLSQDTVLAADLRIGPNRFQKLLFKDQIVGRFDTRITGESPDAVDTYADYDPSLSYFLPAYTGAFNIYVRDHLGYENDLQYEVLSPRVGPWNWGDSGRGGSRQGPLYVGDNLGSAMRKNPHLKVLVASGYFDLATPYFASDYTFAHIPLSKSLRQNITYTYYTGGHMMYHEKASLKTLHKDIAAFIEATLKETAKQGSR